jgi:hypothetical protein
MAILNTYIFRYLSCTRKFIFSIIQTYKRDLRVRALCLTYQGEFQNNNLHLNRARLCNHLNSLNYLNNAKPNPNYLYSKKI